MYNRPFKPEAYGSVSNLLRLNDIKVGPKMLEGLQAKDKAGRKVDKHPQIDFSKYVSLVMKNVTFFTCKITESELEDLFQQGYLSLLEAFHEYDGQNNFIEFAQRKINRELKKARRNEFKLRKLRSKLRSLSIPEDIDQPSLYIQAEEAKLFLKTALDELKPKQRETVKRSFGIEEHLMTIAEIATEKQKTPQSIRDLKKRGLKGLAQDSDLQSFVS